MNNINHPNIMHLFEFLESANNYYLVINYCNKGDLENFLMKQPGHRLTETHALYFLKQIMNGFQVLLNYRVMHRDFKLANIFLHDDTVVIGDFGFAKSGYDMAQTRLGTPYTMAPEVHSGTSAYTSKADLWSIGMVFYQLLYGEFPFTGLSVPELMASIREKSGKNLTFPDQVNRVSDEIKVLLVSLLQMDPKDRISWEDFFNHPVFLRDMANTSEQASNQGQLLIANHVKAVEKEFKDNKKQIQEMKDVSFTDATGANMISAEQINETLSDSPLDKRPLFKEYSFRYYHEKNKILVIFLTVKKLRQLMKERPFREHLHTLYLLMMVLAKKGAELSELTILSLAKKNNIFRLEQFDAYCQDTPEYQETLEQLNKDQQIINDYRRYIKQLRNELGLSAEENDIFLMCEQQFIELRTLDETARNLFHHLRELGEPDFLNTSPTSRHFYLLTMVFTIYSIRSEAYLPYIGNDNNKFEWDTFKQKHDDLNCDQLNQLLLELER